MKRLFLLILSVALALSCIGFAGAVSAKSAILIEAETGALLYAKNENERRPMASTTKIMTAVVVLENARLDAIVTVSGKAAGTEGSSMHLLAGEKISVRELLYGMMLVSGNDAANALAEYVGGSISGFVKLMNKKAQKLGLENTSFETPSGLDGEKHYSTALDMARLTAYALKNPTFAEIVATKTIKLGSRYLVNHNKLLFSYEYAVGVKTGYTRLSGRCLVSAARKNGVLLVAVTLSAGDDWNDHKEMYESAFPRIFKTEYAKKDDIYKIPVVGANEAFAFASPNGDLYGISLDNEKRAKVTVELPRFVYAPLDAGDTVGKITVEIEGQTPIQTDIIITQKIEILPRQSLFERLKRLFTNERE